MRRKRIPSWLLLAGLAAGLLLGVAYTWLISPVKYTDTAPANLREDFKNQYRSAIALAYQSTGNLERARARLILLEDTGSPQVLASQAQRLLAEGYPAEAAALAQLSADLQNPPTARPRATITLTPSPNQGPTATLDLTQTVRTATITPSPLPTLTPRATFTPRPTLTPTATLGAPFALQSKRQICDPSLPQGLLQIEVVNSAGNPVPGMRIMVSWSNPNGEDSFYTGLVPEISPGYADFQMTPGINYTVRVGEGGQPAEGWRTMDCTAPNGDTYPGGWWLTFAQP